MIYFPASPRALRLRSLATLILLLQQVIVRKLQGQLKELFVLQEGWVLLIGHSLLSIVDEAALRSSSKSPRESSKAAEPVVQAQPVAAQAAPAPQPVRVQTVQMAQVHSHKRIHESLKRLVTTFAGLS